MSQFLILLKKELKELIRTKKVLILGIVLLVFAVLSPLLVNFTPEIVGKVGELTKINIPAVSVVDSYLQFFKNLSQALILVMIILFAGSITDEKNRKTIKTLFTNGVTLPKFVWSKVLSQVIVTTILFIISIIPFLICTQMIFKTISVPNNILAFLSIYIFLIFIIALVNLISGLCKKTVNVIIIVVVLFTILCLFSMIPVVGNYIPTALLSASSNLINGMKDIGSVVITQILTMIISLLLVISTIFSKKVS